MKEFANSSEKQKKLSTNNKNMYILEKEFSIDCAHHLQDSESLTTKKCLNMHGHTYRIIVKIQVNELKDGMVIDFGRLKDIVNYFDHKLLNETLEQPTAENLSQELWAQIDNEFDRDAIVEVTVYETPTSKITYKL